MTKEQFLEKNGVLLQAPPPWSAVPQQCLPVCLVDNGPFTAAAIAYDAAELAEFANPRDQRPKLWFLVNRELLKDYL
jgi:hypothetical protein